MAEKQRKIFDRNKLSVKSIYYRKHCIDITHIMALESNKYNRKDNEIINQIAKRVIKVKKTNAALVMMIGAHVIRAGVQNYLINLMKSGYISCLAMNGACMIHDFEFAMIGATTESVARYIRDGQFGLWEETGILNDIINKAYQKDSTIGMGNAVGQAISEADYPYKDISVLAAAHRLKVPVTIHVGIGHDIIHELPNCDGAATGALSYNDFLIFASIILNLENGVIMNFGSAVMAPEVFLKALSMARNVAHQKGKVIKNFATVVCDLHDIPSNISEEPSKDNVYYYFRPLKTMLIRTVADGGESFYLRGRHEDTIPSLWSAVNAEEKRMSDV